MNENHRLDPFDDYINSSFVDVLRRESPHLLPGAGLRRRRASTCRTAPPSWPSATGTA